MLKMYIFGVVNERDIFLLHVVCKFLMCACRLFIILSEFKLKLKIPRCIR